MTSIGAPYKTFELIGGTTAPWVDNCTFAIPFMPLVRPACWFQICPNQVYEISMMECTYGSELEVYYAGESKRYAWCGSEVDTVIGPSETCVFVKMLYNCLEFENETPCNVTTSVTARPLLVPAITWNSPTESSHLSFTVTGTDSYSNYRYCGIIRSELFERSEGCLTSMLDNFVFLIGNCNDGMYTTACEFECSMWYSVPESGGSYIVVMFDYYEYGIDDYHELARSTTLTVPASIERTIEILLEHPIVVGAPVRGMWSSNTEIYIFDALEVWGLSTEGEA